MKTKDNYFAAIAAPVPTGTKSYKPVPNSTLIHELQDGIYRSGLTVKSEGYELAANQNQLFGVMTINAYNPNSVAPTEMKLLELSIWEDGYTMPIVCYYLADIDKYEIVDGFHRYTVLKTSKRIFDREKGMLPVVVIEKAISERMASTIRHNRARGTHSIDLMVNIVAELTEAGMSDAWILRNIGMDADELLRLKQISGLAALFKNNEFTQI